MHNTTPHTRGRLHDVTAVSATGVDGTLAGVPLGELELAENPRKAISPEGIERLAAMLMRLGQLTPCLGWRPAPGRPARLCDGQRRLLAAQASERLADGAGFEGLAPVRSLVVLLLDHEPSREEILRIQAQANAARSSRSSTSRPSSATAGRPAPGCPRPTGSPLSAPTWASRPRRRTTCAAS